MARIRSVHPGLTTDETYMGFSMAAKATWPTLWTECDDNGVFEWKPVVLKARLLPYDTVDFGAILDEYVAAGAVLKYEVGGRSYGLVRNFLRYQRPKKPNPVHPIPDEYRTFAGSSPRSSEPVPHQGGTGSENSPQMEDEGGRREEGGREESISDDIDSADAGSSSGKSYAFEAKTIKLSEKHFNDWKRAFPRLSLEAELWALDEWAGKQGKTWFNAVAGALAKKERAATDRVNVAQANRDSPAPKRREGRI
jgi:hypothetical protein